MEQDPRAPKHWGGDLGRSLNSLADGFGYSTGYASPDERLAMFDKLWADCRLLAFRCLVCHNHMKKCLESEVSYPNSKVLHTSANLKDFLKRMRETETKAHAHAESHAPAETSNNNNNNSEILQQETRSVPAAAAAVPSYVQSQDHIARPRMPDARVVHHRVIPRMTASSAQSVSRAMQAHIGVPSVRTSGCRACSART